MVFSTISAYLDPANWQQQQQYYQTTGSGGSLLPPVLPQQPPLLSPALPHGGGGAGTVRPGSVADRARMVNMPIPETALKCPRCDSTNTKFCYFNNYSLTQPRHFCKTCRRYWTRGGALRNVPVGGGCRRNKRSSSKSSGGTATSNSETAASRSTSSTLLPSNTSTASVTAGNSTSSSNSSAIFSQLRFMAPMSSQLGGVYSSGDDAGLINNYTTGILAPAAAATSDFQMGSVFGGGGGGVSSVLLSSGEGVVEQWRLQRYPNCLGGFDPSWTTEGGMMLYSNNNYESGGSVEVGGGGGRAKLSNSCLISQMAAVKMESISSTHNKSSTSKTDEEDMGREFSGSVQLGGNDHDHQWINGAGGTTSAWTDLSGRL